MKKNSGRIISLYAAKISVIKTVNRKKTKFS